MPTVLSRCVLVKLHPLPEQLVREKLAELGIAAGLQASCAAFARGNPGRAQALAQSAEFAEMRTLALDVADRAGQLEITDIFGLYGRFEKWKDTVQDLLDMIYICLRDKLVQSLADASRLKPLLDGLDAVAETKLILRRNGNFQLAVENMLMKLCL